MEDRVVENNFIVKAYDICSKMEENTEKYVKSAKDREKDVEEMWKSSNAEKQKKQLELAHNYKIMAFVSTAFLITSVACGVGQVTMNLSNPTDASKQLADLLKSLGDTGTSFGSKVADNISGSATSSQNALIEELTQNASQLWDVRRPEREKEKSDKDQLRETIKSSLRDAIDKAGSTYSVRG